MTNRLMRLRQSQWMRDLLAETEFNQRQLIQPLFVVEGLSRDEEILGLGETKRNTEESILQRVEKDLEAGVRHFLLFHVPKAKAECAFHHEAAQRVIQKLKSHFGDQLFLWIDTCLCSMTSHGHCGVLRSSQTTSNPFDSSRTLNEISRAALAYVEAGADGVSPSDMMDGRVKHIRALLDEKGYDMKPIMSYSTKFSSHFYGPFRNAANSTPQFGDRQQYQIDVRSSTDALNSSQRCAEEGADLLMVKPGMSSIDLIKPIAQKCHLPVGAYQVSGEYAGLQMLSEKGLVHFEKALLETWHVFKRAGAQYIITYGARESRKLGLR